MKLQAQHIGFDNAVAILNQGIQAIDSGDSVMDMQDVQKTDSAAVAVVLEWMRRAQARNAELKVINAPELLPKFGQALQSFRPDQVRPPVFNTRTARRGH